MAGCLQEACCQVKVLPWILWRYHLSAICDLAGSVRVGCADRWCGLQAALEKEQGERARLEQEARSREEALRQIHERVAQAERHLEQAQQETQAAQQALQAERVRVCLHAPSGHYMI